MFMILCNLMWFHLQNMQFGADCLSFQSKAGIKYPALKGKVFPTLSTSIKLVHSMWSVLPQLYGALHDYPYLPIHLSSQCLMITVHKHILALHLALSLLALPLSRHPQLLCHRCCCRALLGHGGGCALEGLFCAESWSILCGGLMSMMGFG